MGFAFCVFGQVWLAARFIVAGIGSIPNSELFRDALATSADGGIITDPSLRTSHPSGDVFAAGDVACVRALVPGDDDDRNFPAVAVRSEHVQAARDMGAHAAQSMSGAIGVQAPYEPVPQMYCRSVLS